MTEGQTIEFVPLIGFEDKYEILNQYPFTIRRKDNHHVIKERYDKDGYITLCLNQNNCRKHRIIAIQFIQNDDPNNKTQIDHIDGDVTNNHIENLRWCSASENCKNKSSVHNIEYEYVDTLPDDAIVVNDYGKHHFEGYYYCDNIFYFDNGVRIRKMHINEHKTGQKFVSMMNTNGKYVKVHYLNFKKLYGVE